MLRFISLLAAFLILLPSPALADTIDDSTLRDIECVSCYWILGIGSASGQIGALLFEVFRELAMIIAKIVMTGMVVLGAIKLMSGEVLGDGIRHFIRIGVVTFFCLVFLQIGTVDLVWGTKDDPGIAGRLALETASAISANIVQLADSSARPEWALPSLADYRSFLESDTLTANYLASDTYGIGLAGSYFYYSAERVLSAVWASALPGTGWAILDVINGSVAQSLAITIVFVGCIVVVGWHVAMTFFTLVVASTLFPLALSVSYFKWGQQILIKIFRYILNIVLTFIITAIIFTIAAKMWLDVLAFNSSSDTIAGALDNWATVPNSMLFIFVGGIITFFVLIKAKSFADQLSEAGAEAAEAPLALLMRGGSAAAGGGAAAAAKISNAGMTGAKAAGGLAAMQSERIKRMADSYTRRWNNGVLPGEK